MIKVAITGNMGSGKSIVCFLFERLKVPVFYADQEAKALYSRPDIYQKMRLYFGRSVYNKQKDIIASKLAKRIFNKPEDLSFVNNLIHPAVYERFEEWLKEHKDSKYILYEAAILFETKSESKFDKVILVSAPEFLRIERILSRDKTSLKAIKGRMEKQWPEEMKIAHSDFVITNDGKTMLLPQIFKIHKTLLES